MSSVWVSPHKPWVVMGAALQAIRGKARWEPRAVWLKASNDPAGLETLWARWESLDKTMNEDKVIGMNIQGQTVT